MTKEQAKIRYTFTLLSDSKNDGIAFEEYEYYLEYASLD